ncbi:MAG: hypothetical protein WBP81_21075 [Solirubrobacteraceae bacterium]
MASNAARLPVSHGEAGVRIISREVPALRRSSHLLASGSKTAAQPQTQEQAPVRASRLGAFQQTPAEDREITDRLLTIEVRASS